MHQPTRVSLRHLDEQGQARDLVGDLVVSNETRVVVLPAGRGPVEVARSAVQTMRRVPPRVVRPTSSVDDLVRLTAQGWPGTKVVRMGGWSLHTGDGYSRRANSCHPTGDPERPLDDALDGIASYYRGRGLRPCLQVAARDLTSDEPGAQLDAQLADRGWRAVTPSTVMTVDLRGQSLAADALAVDWDTQPDAAWLGVEPSSHPARVDVLASAEAHYATWSVDGSPAGTGRLAITDDWAGLTCLFVDPAHRGRGHGRALTIAMMARARELGARWAYLQVNDDNDIARRLYDSLGFAEHHRYHYRELVS